MKELGRLLTAMVTPFDDDGAVNHAAAQDLDLERVLGVVRGARDLITFGARAHAG